MLSSHSMSPSPKLVHNTLFFGSFLGIVKNIFLFLPFLTLFPHHNTSLCFCLTETSQDAPLKENKQFCNSVKNLETNERFCCCQRPELSLCSTTSLQFNLSWTHPGCSCLIFVERYWENKIPEKDILGEAMSSHKHFPTIT